MTNIITTQTKTELVQCDKTADVLKRLFESESQTVTHTKERVFETAEVQELTWRNWNIEGSISVSEDDSVLFTGLSRYSDVGSDIVELSFMNWDKRVLVLSSESVEFLTELVEFKLIEDYHHEMYALYEKEQEDMHEQDLEDELMGN